jgi:hypothetical protein
LVQPRLEAEQAGIQALHVVGAPIGENTFDLGREPCAGGAEGSTARWGDGEPLNPPVRRLGKVAQQR